MLPHDLALLVGEGALGVEDPPIDAERADIPSEPGDVERVAIRRADPRGDGERERRDALARSPRAVRRARSRTRSRSRIRTVRAPCIASAATATNRTAQPIASTRSLGLGARRILISRTIAPARAARYRSVVRENANAAATSGRRKMTGAHSASGPNSATDMAAEKKLTRAAVARVTRRRFRTA
jgi:hypothetical protein